MKKSLRLFALIVILTVFLAWVRKNLAPMDWKSVAWNPWEIAISLLMLQIAFSLNILAVRMTYQELGATTSLRTAYTIYFISNLGRYIPGRVWQILSTVYFANRNGIPFGKSLLLFSFNQAIAILTNLAVAIVFIKAFPTHLAISLVVVFAYCALILVFFLDPNLFINLLNRLFRFLCMREIALHIRRLYVLKLFIIYACSIVFTGAGFLMLIAGVGLQLRYPLILIAACPLAYAAGYLSMLTPGGIGVREGIIVFLMKTIYPDKESSLIGLAALIWAFFSEITNSMIALWLCDSSVFREMNHGLRKHKKGYSSDEVEEEK